MDYIAAIRHVCEILNRHTVKYMIVGGTAVALHGYFRSSTDASGEITDKPDLDLWYHSDYENYFKLLKALRDLEKNVSEYENEAVPNPKKSFLNLNLMISASTFFRKSRLR